MAANAGVCHSAVSSLRLAFFYFALLWLVIMLRPLDYVLSPASIETLNSFYLENISALMNAVIVVQAFFIVSGLWFLSRYRRASACLAEYREIFERFPSGAMVVDSKGFIVYSNRAIREMFGGGSHAPGERFFSSERLRIFSRDGSTIHYAEHPVVASMFTGRRIDDFDMGIDAGGRIRWLRVTVIPGFSGEGRVLAIYEDITAVHEYEKMLRENEERFRLMVENTPVGVCVIDDYGIFEYANQAFAAIYGFETDELIGRHITLIVLENLYELALRDIDSFVANGVPEGQEWSARRKNGEKIHVLANSASVNWRGSSRRIIFVTDITDRKEMEDELVRSREEMAAARDAAESLNRVKSVFVASVSHELRSPLNGIMGFSELLAARPLQNEAAEMVGYIKKCASDLLATVNDILDLSKIEAGKLELDERPFDLAEAARETMAIFAPAASAKGISLSFIVRGDICHAVISDRHRYRQVLSNLISNAVKFTSHGGVAVEIVLIGESAEFYGIETAVRDTGPGISPAIAKVIFEPFFQADRTVAGTYGGTGLGLSICSRLVALMGGGTIAVNGRPGEGSRFSFLLNLRKGDGLADNVKTA